MDARAFDDMVGRRRADSIEGDALEFDPFDALLATEADLQRAERDLGVQLPDQYRSFMMKYGGGQFLFVDLLPVVPISDWPEDLISVNSGWFRDPGFISVAPVGTGDWWGFAVDRGICSPDVLFKDHETGRTEPAAADFLDFLASLVVM